MASGVNSGGGVFLRLDVTHPIGFRGFRPVADKQKRFCTNNIAFIVIHAVREGSWHKYNYASFIDIISSILKHKQSENLPWTVGHPEHMQHSGTL